jgi:hypothetical protein
MDKSRYFSALAEKVASGQTIRSAAAEIGCSESRAYRLSVRPEFRSTVSQLRTASMDAALGRLSQAASRAVERLEWVLECDDVGSVVRAASVILDRFSKLSESVDLRKRIELIEEQLCQNEK